MLLARARLAIDLAGVRSEEASAALVGAAARRAAPGEWLTGRGWDQTLWEGQRFPTKASLDRVAPTHPVALTRVDGHATWANSAALADAGITRSLADPAGGRIVRAENGESRACSSTRPRISYALGNLPHRRIASSRPYARRSRTSSPRG